jgi:hypothetical protein
MAQVHLDRREAERSDLPRVCMYCGRKATQTVRRRFHWYPPVGFLPLMRMFLTKRMYVGMPVCGSHAHTFRLLHGPSLWGLRPVNITNISITLAGVSEEFAEALHNYRRGQEPEILDDEEREERRKRRVREEEERVPAGSSGSTAWIWVMIACIVLVPVVICGGIGVLISLAPPRTNPGWAAPPTFPALGPPAAAQEIRVEQLGLLAVAPDSGGVATIPWAALAVATRKEPIKLLTDDEMDKLLADLATQDGSKAPAAADRLAKVFPNEERRAEVARALEKLTTHWQFNARSSAAHALVVWAIPDNMPALIKMLDDTVPSVRAEAMNALAALKDERGARAVAKMLTSLPDRGNAAKALETMGPVAEKAVLPFLTNPDAQVKVEACHILKAIGTQDSVAALQTAAQDKNRLVSQAAQDALTALAGRP